MNIAIYTITSELHDAKSIDATTRAFLESLDITYDMRGNDFSDYGSHALDSSPYCTNCNSNQSDRSTC